MLLGKPAISRADIARRWNTRSALLLLCAVCCVLCTLCCVPWDGNSVFHMLELAVEPEQDPVDGEQALYGRVESLCSSSTTAKMKGQRLEGDSVLSSHQLNESERAIEMNISMRLQKEAEEEDEAFEVCTSPLQVSAQFSCQLRKRWISTHVTQHCLSTLLHHGVPVESSHARISAFLQASGLLSAMMASAVSAAEDADQADQELLKQFAGSDDHEALIPRPPSSSGPKSAGGRARLSSRGGRRQKPRCGQLGAGT